MEEGLYQVSPSHWFAEMRRAWLVLVRARCTCGHRTRPCLTLDGAAHELLVHQINTGTKVA